MADQAPISKSEAESLKSVLLASVSAGAHGAMSPHQLAESLIAAFRLIDESAAAPSLATGGTA